MQNAREEVTKLYISLFGRATDLEGLEFWSGRIKAGETVSSVASQMFSVEPARRFFPEGLDKGGIVNAFYRNVLGRDADADGQAYWSKQMESGKAIGEVLSTIVAATDNYSGSDPNGLQSARLFANKKAVSEAYVEKLTTSGVTQTNEVATSVAVSIIEQVKVNTVLNDFISDTVRRAAEFTKVAIQNPDEVQKLLPASGSIADLKNIMPQGTDVGDVFEFAKRIVEIADNPNQILEIVSVGNQGRLTFNSEGKLINRYGEVMVIDSGGKLAPAPREVPVGMMRDAQGTIVADPNAPLIDFFGNPIERPQPILGGGSSPPPPVGSLAPPTADGRVIMTNQGPMAYNPAGQLVNRFGEIMVLDSGGQWAPAPRDVPVGMLRDSDGKFIPDPNFTTDIFGNRVDVRYDPNTSYQNLTVTAPGYTGAYSAATGVPPVGYIPPGYVPPNQGFIPPGYMPPDQGFIPPGYVPPNQGFIPPGYMPPDQGFVPPGGFFTPDFVPQPDFVPPWLPPPPDSFVPPEIIGDPGLQNPQPPIPV